MAGNDREPRDLPIAGLPPGLGPAQVSGPEAHFPPYYPGFDDYHHPLLRKLRKRFGIDEVISGSSSQFETMLRLRHWVHTRWRLTREQRYTGPVIDILEKAESGMRFHCAHSMAVQQAVLSAYGFVVRNLGVDRNHEDLGRSNHHGANEVWSNDHAKWVVFDAEHDFHFERDGVPLSALDVHEAVRAGRFGDICKRRGPSRRKLPPQSTGINEDSVHNYYWVSWQLRADTFTHAHWSGSDRLLVYDSDAFRSTTWMRQRDDAAFHKHWGYRGGFIRLRDRDEIEWTPGVPDVTAEWLGGRRVGVRLRSATPNFAEYRITVDGHLASRSPNGEFEWRLHPGPNACAVRTRNLFGVDGPEVTLSLAV